MTEHSFSTHARRIVTTKRPILSSVPSPFRSCKIQNIAHDTPTATRWPTIEVLTTLDRSPQSTQDPRAGDTITAAPLRTSAYTEMGNNVPGKMAAMKSMAPISNDREFHVDKK